MRKFKDVKFTDDDFAIINNLIDKMGLNGEKKFSEVLDDLDRKYNISQDDNYDKAYLYRNKVYDKFKKLKDISCKVHLL